MNWALKSLSGPLRDQIFTIEAGSTLGRRETTILIPDHRVSNVHAKVEANETGQLLLVDNGSKNGIRDGQGLKCDRLLLQPGVEFSIGEHKFAVVQTEAPPAKRKSYWFDVLAEALLSQGPNWKDRPKDPTPLKPAVVLEFIRGVQTRQSWTLGFGPRRIGGTCMDLPIYEEQAPPVCFEIHPSDKGILFTTEHSDIVRINGQSLDSHVLRVGDTIQIRETLIEVDFVE